MAQSPQNLHASYLRCLPLSTIQRIRRRGGSEPGCTLSSRATKRLDPCYLTLYIEKRQVSLGV
jgi:hypothetical protein